MFVELFARFANAAAAAAVVAAVVVVAVENPYHLSLLIFSIQVFLDLPLLLNRNIIYHQIAMNN